MPRALGAEAIEAAASGRLGRPVRFFDAIGSTNDEAWSWASDGAPEGALVVADHQTRGRGRWDRAWIDRPGSSLMFSLILRPPPDLEAASLLTTTAGLACAEAIEAVSGLKAGIKWPNDVTIDGKKIAGLLVESATRGERVEVAVVGCGVNMQLPAGLPADVADGATSISDALNRSEPGRQVDRVTLLAAILSRFEHSYGRLTDSHGRAEVLRRAEQRSIVLGTMVTARLADGRSYSGIARGLASSGALELEVDGGRFPLHSAEITQLRSSRGPPSA